MLGNDFLLSLKTVLDEEGSIAGDKDMLYNIRIKWQFSDNFINIWAVLCSSNRKYFGQGQYFSLFSGYWSCKQIPCKGILQQSINTTATRAWQSKLSLFVWNVDIFLRLHQRFGCRSRGKCSVHFLQFENMSLRAMNFGRETPVFFFSRKAYTWVQYVDLNPEVL